MILIVYENPFFVVRIFPLSFNFQRVAGQKCYCNYVYSMRGRRGGASFDVANSKEHLSGLCLILNVVNSALSHDALKSFFCRIIYSLCTTMVLLYYP